MSYRIEYGTAVPVKFQPERRKRYVRVITAVFLLVFVLYAAKIWPEGRLVLQRVFLPGEPTVTQQAFADMISELSDGISLENALVTFCQQIIDHGAGDTY